MPIPYLKTPKNLHTLAPKAGRIAGKGLARLRAGLSSVFARVRTFLRNSKNRGRMASWGANLLLGGVLITVVAGVSGAILVAWLAATLGDPAKILESHQVQSTKIYDRTGQTVLYEVAADERRTVVALADIPQHVREATIAIEDRKFYEHKGLRITSLVRAVLTDIFSRKLAQGGSTITQQLVKNAILTNEKRITRKIKEIVLSWQIERKLTKDQILELYFNEIPYGGVTYGIEAASRQFFGKSVRDLDLAEAAMLAAIPQSPTRYSPYGNHTDELENRRKLVLQKMVDEGYVTQDQAEAAKATDVLARIKPRRDAITAPHFVIWVRELLSEKYGDTLLTKGGLKVITTLDLDKQRLAEEAVTDGIAGVERSGGSNAGLVSIDPRSGEVLTMVGSRDYFDEEHDGAVNITLRPLQPGSSFKPVVYTAGFLKGYTPDTVLYDVNTTFRTDTRNYEPKNYDLKEHGPVTVRTALQGSLNIPAVKMLYLTGIDRVLDLAEALGYTTLGDRSRFGLALVLGGAEVKPIEHAAAFGVFTNDGVRMPMTAILKVEDASGRVLEEWKKGEGTRVLDEQFARQITNITSDNEARAYVFGARNYLTLPGRPAATKTGTTNDFRDAWTVGGTPSLVTAVWTGNNDHSEMHRGADGSKIAAPIWQQYMSEALKGTPVENFQAPAPVKTGKPILDGELMPKTTVMIDRASGLLATSSTPDSMIEIREYTTVHDTLFWVDRDDPRGPPPSNPANDPQYTSWEASVQAWATKQEGLVLEAPPTEYTTVRDPSTFPRVQLLSPAENATLATRDFTVSLDISAPRGPVRAVALLDGQVIGSSSVYPFAGPYTIPNRFGKGFHTLEIQIFDDVDNMGSDQSTINLTADPAPLGASWIVPTQSARIPLSEFPVSLRAALNDDSGVRSLEFLATDIEGGETRSLGSVSNPGTRPVVARWDRPAPGSYRLWLRVMLEDGQQETIRDERQVVVE
ncbi:PBP1A family penicillin-binding protein [Patescibacteria group bacterium]|nr:MAG: PBP1A family penicillin-binding protein [Patescibacteria group bacterium]